MPVYLTFPAEKTMGKPTHLKAHTVASSGKTHFAYMPAAWHSGINSNFNSICKTFQVLFIYKINWSSKNRFGSNGV